MKYAVESFGVCSQSALESFWRAASCDEKCSVVCAVSAKL